MRGEGTGKRSQETAEGIEKTKTIFLSPNPRGESVSRRTIWLIISNTADRSSQRKADNLYWIRQEQSPQSEVRSQKKKKEKKMR